MAGPLDRTPTFTVNDRSLPANQESRSWLADGNEFAALTGPRQAREEKTSADGPKSATQEISSTASQEEIKKTLAGGAQGFDLSTLFAGGRRAAFFGERHDDPGHKDEIIKNLQDLKENAGLTHVALEMLNDADMPAVRNYFAGTGSREAVLERLKARWSVTPEAPEKYMELIDAVKAARLTPLALDRVERGHDDSRGTLFMDRNQHWADVIGGVLQADKNAKVLVYSGYDHIGYGDRPHANEILKSDYGLASSVVLMASKFDKPQTLPAKVAQAAADLNMEHRQFVLRLQKNTMVRPADIVLHVP